MDDIDESSILVDECNDVVVLNDSSNEDEEGEVPMDNCDYMVGHPS